jgi:hypothetical protein
MVDLQKFKPPQAATKLGDIPEISSTGKTGYGSNQAIANLSPLRFWNSFPMRNWPPSVRQTACAPSLSIFRLTT